MAAAENREALRRDLEMLQELTKKTDDVVEKATKPLLEQIRALQETIAVDPFAWFFWCTCDCPYCGGHWHAMQAKDTLLLDMDTSAKAETQQLREQLQLVSPHSRARTRFPVENPLAGPLIDLGWPVYSGGEPSEAIPGAL